MAAAVEVGIREIKANLSRYLKQVKAGASVVVTERGKPVARILPIGESAQKRARDLVAAGLVSWNGEKFVPPEIRPAVRGGKTVAELLLEDRE
ncbi:MAG: type II toxin-antitoxin system prevent-host-death family antitoxin [Acidobacteriota bacterium]